MYKKWNDYDLPESMEVNGNIYCFKNDYKSILEVMKPLNDVDLLDDEKIICAMRLFFTEYDSILSTDFVECAESMMLFIAGNKTNTDTKQEKPLIDWEKDLSIIIAPINRIAGYDIRRDSDMHWWTFLSYFMEIGECTLNTFIGIRDKKNKGKKLEKHEEEIYKNNKQSIDIKPKIESEVQDVMAEIKALIGKR